MSKENQDLLNDLISCLPVEQEDEATQELQYIDAIERELDLQLPVVTSN
jgi:hypothetical protein